MIFPTIQMNPPTEYIMHSRVEDSCSELRDSKIQELIYEENGESINKSLECQCEYCHRQKPRKTK